MAQGPIRVAMIVAVIAVVGCGRPPLRVTTDERSVIIDMQTLGEYPSDVARVRLTEAASNRVVWEIRGRGEPQLGRVQLNVGRNPVAATDVGHGTYEVLVPAAASTFMLEANKRYRVEVWGKDGVARSKRQAEFITPGGRTVRGS